MFHGTLTLTGGHCPPPILKIQPGDIIIVQSPHQLPREHMDHIGSNTKKLFPDHKVIVFGGGIHLEVAREENLPKHEQLHISLQPCPCCGSKARYEYFSPPANNSTKSVAVSCKQHCCMTARYHHEDAGISYQAAADDWNHPNWREKHIGKPSATAGDIPPPTPSII